MSAACRSLDSETNLSFPEKDVFSVNLKPEWRKCSGLSSEEPRLQCSQISFRKLYITQRELRRFGILLKAVSFTLEIITGTEMGCVADFQKSGEYLSQSQNGHMILSNPGSFLG